MPDDKETESTMTGDLEMDGALATEEGADAPPATNEQADAPPTSTGTPSTAPAAEAVSTPAPDEKLASATAQLEASRQAQAELNRRNAALEATHLRQEQERQLQQYGLELQQDGYDAAQVSQAISHRKAGLDEISTLRQQVVDTQAQAQIAVQEASAKVKVATHFAKEYGVPIESMMEFATPSEMEISALKSSIAKGKEAAAPAQKFEQSSTEGSSAGSSRARLTVLTNKEGNWTEQEYEEASRLRGTG